MMSRDNYDNYGKEHAMCENIMPVLKTLFEQATEKQTAIVHNSGQKNNDGSDFTITINGKDFEADAKCYQSIRDGNYKTHFIEVAQWAKKETEKFQWLPGWIYSPLGDLIIDIVPCGNEYSEYFANETNNYAICVCDKHQMKNVAKANYNMPIDAVWEAEDIENKINSGLIRLKESLNCFAGKSVDGHSKLLTYKRNSYGGIQPDNYNLIVPIADSFCFGGMYYDGKLKLYRDFYELDKIRRILTER